MHSEDANAGQEPRSDKQSTPNHSSSGEPPQPRQLDLLVALAEEHCKLFHDQRERPYAQLPNGVIYRIHGGAFSKWMQRTYRQEVGRAANPAALKAALEEVAAAAMFDGDERTVSLRVAEHEGGLAIDLGEEHACAILVESKRFRVGRPQSAFERKPHSFPLPRPVEGGSVELLRELLNLQSFADLKLVVGWALMALRPRGPYPVLVLQGEPGSAKSTATEIVKKLIDPTLPNLRSLPRSSRDLAVAADGNWILAFDNISFLPGWLSDALCRLATGGGFGTRALYTNEEETVFDQMRPVILNGLDAVATRQDLLDRSMVLRLPVIEQRLTEDQLQRRFTEVAPLILGALVEAVADGLARLPHVEAPDLPRMADFGKWVTAAEVSFGWEEGSILTAFRENQASALRTSLEGSPLATAVQQLLAENPEFGATPTELHNALTLRAPDNQLRTRAWPKNAQAMSRQLTRLAPALRQLGIEIDEGHTGRGQEKSRWIELRLSRPGDEGAGGDA
jgi:hypothetical protein